MLAVAVLLTSVVTASVADASIKSERAGRPLGVQVSVDALPPGPPTPYRSYIGVSGGVALAEPSLAPAVGARAGVMRAGVQLGVRVDGTWGFREPIGALGTVTVDATAAALEVGYCRSLARAWDGCARVGLGHEWTWGRAEGAGLFQRRARRDGTIVGTATLGLRWRQGRYFRAYLTVDTIWRATPPRFTVEGIADETALARFGLRPRLGAELAFF